MTGIELKSPYVRLGWAASKIAQDLAHDDLADDQIALEAVERLLPDDGIEFKARVLEKAGELLEDRMSQLQGEIEELSIKVEALKDARQRLASAKEVMT
jgi:hypothetical protein